MLPQIPRSGYNERHGDTCAKWQDGGTNVAKKRTDGPKEPRKPNRTGVPLHVYIPAQLDADLTAHATKNRRKVTAEVIIALEEYLRAAGALTEPKPAEPGDE